MFDPRRRCALPGLFAAALIFSLCDVCGVLPANAQRLEQAPKSALGAASRVMTLDSLSDEGRAAQALLKDPKMLRELPENFREFGTARTGQVVDTKSLTLRFAAAATLTTIKGTPDFKVEQGGSCVEGYSYQANETCTLLVRFTPQGPGRRTGKLMVTNSVDAEPLTVGIGGQGYSPTVSFTPSIISTVPQTVSGGNGILIGARSLAVDGGDALYMADTGHKQILYLGSDNVLQTIALGTLTDPQGVALDGYNNVYISQDNPASVVVGSAFGGSSLYNRGSTSCSYGSTCFLGGAEFQTPGDFATDPDGNIFLSDYGEAYQLDTEGGPYDENYIPLYDPYNFTSVSNGNSGALAVDGYDSLYTYMYFHNICTLISTTYSDAAAAHIGHAKAVAGGRGCGFSGDGGQARSALIGTTVAQMVFDAAGNLYFTDTTNQRVRRIDGATGIITTIAGNGSTGFSGDGGPATSAALSNPTGLAVDSQGQVYVISGSSATNGLELVRKVGTVGALNLGGITVGSSSTAQTVTVANTGNSNLDFTHVGFSSGNTSDFAMDPNTTSCNFTAPLAAGRSCKIGFIFTPGATGGRSAVLSITDDTVTGINTINLSGTGYTTATLAPASFTFASTTVGSSTASQTATLTNTGKAVLTISSIAFSGTGAASYADTTTCGTTVAVGASCTIAVTFKPTTTGTPIATLTVNDSALGGHQSMSLTGTAVAAAAKPSLSPTSLTFASTAVGATSGAQTIKLSNTGTAALGITSIKMAGTDPGDFPLTQNCGTSVAAGGSCTISVSFKPVATGTRTGTVTIVASTGTLSISASGTAAAAAAKKSTRVTLSIRKSFAADDRAVVLGAQVSGGSAVVPNGRVQLWEGSRMWAESKFSEGIAMFKMAGLSQGKHVMTALYLGDADESGSRSAPLTVVVGLPHTLQSGADAQSE